MKTALDTILVGRVDRAAEPGASSPTLVSGSPTLVSGSPTLAPTTGDSAISLESADSRLPSRERYSAPSLRAQIEELRSNLAIDLYIRGTAKKFEILSPTFQFKGHDEDGLPAYHMSPAAQMGAREWISRLHATLYAATAHAVEHGRIGFRVGDELGEDRLPTLMVFGPRTPGREIHADPFAQLKSDYQFAIKSRAQFNLPLLFDFTREQWEFGVVRGTGRATFAESRLPASVDHEGNFRMHAVKIFSLGITAAEHVGLVESINVRLRRFGISHLREVAAAELSQRFDSSGQAARLAHEVLAKARAASCHKGWDFVREASPAGHAAGLYIDAAAAHFTRKFIHTGLFVLDLLRAHSTESGLHSRMRSDSSTPKQLPGLLEGE